MARTRLYRHGTLVLEDFPVGDISDHLADPSSVVWLDLYRPEEADFAMVGEEFGIHALALEDAVHQGQRPKLDHYSTHEFLSTHTVGINADGTGVSTGEISVFLTGQALITVRQDETFAMDDVVARWDRSADLAGHGVGFLSTVRRRTPAEDVYDHVLRAAEQTESVRDVLDSAMQANMSAQSNRMNLIMKKVTSWAAIIAVPTAITGF